MNKTKKSLTKRFRLTKTGKVMRKISGQDHLRSKKSGKQIRQKRKQVELSKPLAKKIKKYLKS